MAVEEAIERETGPEKNRRKRIRYRRISLLFLFAVSVSIIVVGLQERLPIYYTRFKWSWTRYSKTGHSQGWLIDGFPAQYLGYLLLLFTAAGFGGIYIWYGGPLDLRNDQMQENDAESQV